MNLNRNIIALLGVLIIAGPALAAPEGWTVDFEAAKKKAAKENKDLFLEFTGSDWCPPCKALKKNIFDKSYFKKEAPKDFILVKLDYPRDKSNQTKEEIAQNKELQKTYKITGYPTVILASPKGEVYYRTSGFGGGSPENYVKNLRKQKTLHVSVKKYLAEAAKAKGAKKATLLDKAIGEYDAETIFSRYKKEAEEIIKIDAENKAGLKAKYVALKNDVEIQKELQNIFRSSRGNSAKAMEQIDALIEKRQPKGETLQKIYLMKSGMLFQTDKSKAKAMLEKARDIDPKTETGERINSILTNPRFFPKNEKKG